MKIFNTNFKEGYEDICLKNYQQDIEYMEMLSSTLKIKEQWPRIELKLNKKGKKSDIPFFWSTMGDLIISDNCKNKINNFFDKETVELLPMYLEERKYYAVHVIEVDDLNYNLVEDKNGNIRPLFSKEKIVEKNIEDKGIFRVFLINNKPLNTIFITEKFKNNIEKLGLKGLSFEEVWNSEENY